ncbi:MAG: acyltransferase [Lachnospiraceae bacterium]|nr:acyltransferase [Lachnospiraceae bacterium]
MCKRIYFLDYMKAICVLMVIITHIEWSNKNQPIFLFVINMAVPIFMIISGFNFEMSYHRRIEKAEAAMGQEASKLQQLGILYSKENLFPRIRRFAAPFIPICIVELILKALDHVQVSLPRLFLLGGFGPGSYYVPLMFELLAIFPVIYIIMKEHPYAGLCFIGVLQLIYEIWVAMSGFEKYWYRLLIFRYLLLIAFGCMLYLHPEKRLHKRTLLAMFLIGAEYLILYHCGVRYAIFRYWSPTVLPTDFYIIPVVVILFRLFYHKQIPGLWGKLLETIGKASYHIFLVQMVYYHFDLGGPIMEMDWPIQLVLNVLITVSVGVGYYHLESHIRKLIQSKGATA